MNATSYYVSTCRLVIQADPRNQSSWQDIVRFLPMLRNSLSCTVCENLLTEPYTPEETSCQHHVCKGCRGGTKVLRPSCSWCRDYSKYSENPQLRILLQSYRSLCSYIKVTQLYQFLRRNKEHGEHISQIIRESESGLNHVPLSPGACLAASLDSDTPPVSAINPFAVLKQTATSVSASHPQPPSTTLLTSPVKTEKAEESEEENRMEFERTEHTETETTTGKWYCVSNTGDLIPDKEEADVASHRTSRSTNLQDQLTTCTASLSGQFASTDAATSAGHLSSTCQPNAHRDAQKYTISQDSGAAATPEPGHPPVSRKLRRDRVSASKLTSSPVSSASTSSTLSSTSTSLASASHHPVCSQSSVVLKDEVFTSPLVKMEGQCEEQRVDDEVIFRISSPAISKALFQDSPATAGTPDVKQEFAKDVDMSRSDTPSPPNSSRYYTSFTSDPANIRITESYILKPRQDGVEINCSEMSLDDSSSSRIPVVLSRTEKDSSSSQEQTTSLLRPLIGGDEEEGVDPIIHSGGGPGSTSSRNKKSGAGEKQGCRCGNATQTPGKLTCCGQRCPCYVNRSACLSCKCKGCNNPNLPGGGKILPYLDVAINSKNSNRLHSYSHGKVRDIGGGSKTSILSGVGRGTSLLGRGTSMLGGSRGGRGTISTGEGTTNIIQVPAAPQSSDSVDVDINTIPVVNLSSPSSVRTLLGPAAAVQRLLNPNKGSCTSLSSSNFQSQSTTPTSLSTVTIPISSLGPGLKLRPVHQMQGRDLKTARVIPTIKVRGTPYSRLPVNGKVNVGHIRLVTLLKNQKNIQVVKKEAEDTENKATSS